MAISQNPFTKIVEDVMLEVRENSSEVSVERKYQRRVNDIYVRDIPSKLDFDFMRKQGSVSLVANYDTGTCSISSGATDIVGSGTTWTTAMTGRKMKISGNDEIYTFTYSGPSAGTVNVAYNGTTSSSSLTYTIYEDTYNLASDFDRLVVPPGFYYDNGGAKTQIKQLFTDDWYKYYTTTATQDPAYFRLTGRNSTNLNWTVEVQPPVDTARILKYEYIPELTEMTEYITGTCATAAGSTTVVGIGTAFTTAIELGDAFRIDSRPSDWYIINATTSSTNMTLSSAYPNTVAATDKYTICKVPRLPIKLQLAIFYGACFLSSQDQDNNQAAKNYYAMYEKSIQEFIAQQNRVKCGQQRMKVNDMYRRYNR